MSIPFKKYGYELNPITNEYSVPQIFLVDKRLHKIGELYPIQNLNITINEINQADEISFTYNRKTNDTECPYFNRIDDLSVIEVGDYGYFEVSVDKSENSAISKKITGISLGHAELSQILATLEINTDDDTARTDYDKNYPTIFYRNPDEAEDAETKKKYRESSLLHRILSYAPHYKIGSVSETLCRIQRTFSWKDTDIISILNSISEEINCAFNIDIRMEDGKPQRIINVYDMQYCDGCYSSLDEDQKLTSKPSVYRSIVNGVCQNCGCSEHVKGIGMDTNIFISTDNLSDEITIRGDKDSIKNCFKIVGGDDIITSTVNGLNMSASNKIMMFSEKQKKEMSKELTAQLEQYDIDYQANIEDYEKLLETEYNISDIRHYLRSSKMPPLEKEIQTTDMALGTVIRKIKEFYNNKFFINSYENYKKNSYDTARTSIRNLFTTFMPEGYSFTIDYDSMTEKTEDYDSSMSYHWYGKIRVYSTGNRDDSYTIHLQPDRDTYLTQGEGDETYRFSDPDLQSIFDTFSISFTFADQSQAEYIDYIDQHTKYLLSTVDISYENEKERPWNLYSYNRLDSFQSGYQHCIESLEGMKREEVTDTETEKIITDMITNYQKIQKDILSQMSVLHDQLFAISTYHGEFDNDFVDAEGNVTYTLQYYDNIQTVFDHLVDSEYEGGYENGTYKVNEFIGTKPFQCKKCGSSNVSVSTEGNVCRNTDCGGSGSDIYTYLDIMQNIYDSYNSHKNDTLTGMREASRNRFEMGNYLDDELYAELRSFIREDIYTNDNYTSDGLNNTQIIEMAKELMAKAEQELAKSCVPSYTIDAPLSSIVGQKSFLYQGVLVNDDYSGFKINNFVRVRIDGEIYKMRIASICYTFPVTDRIEVTFTNVTRYNAGMLSDVKDILDSAKSMATSYSYIATQAEKGGEAGLQLNTMKEEGLDAALMAVKGGRDQDVVIDDHGILLRRKIQETDTYSDCQMKLIDRNIVMTSNNWETADLAIGLGRYNGELLYGIWAKLLRGDLIAGKELIISNKDENGNHTVMIDEKGIDITNGSIEITNENEYTVTIDPDSDHILDISKSEISNGQEKRKEIMYVDKNGNAFFNGEVYATDGVFNGTVYATNGSFIGSVTAKEGYIGTEESGWEINDNSITNTGDAMIYTIAPKNGSYTKIQSGCVISAGKDGNVQREVNLQNGNALFAGDGHWTIINNDIIKMGHGSIGKLPWLEANIHNDLFQLGTENTKTDLYGTLTIHGVTHFPDNGRVYFGNDVYLFNAQRPSDKAETLFCSTGILTHKSVAIGDEYTGSDGSPYMLSVGGSIKVKKNVYAGDGTALTSDENRKHDIEDPDERYLNLFNNYEVKRFKYNDGTSDRYHLGAIAQSVEDAMEDAGITTQEFAGLIKDGDDYYLRYDELNMLTALKVKSMAKEIELLKKEIEELKKNLK